MFHCKSLTSSVRTVNRGKAFHWRGFVARAMDSGEEQGKKSAERVLSGLGRYFDYISDMFRDCRITSINRQFNHLIEPLAQML